MAARTKAKPLTLTQTAAFMRKFLAVGGIVVVVLMVGRVFLTAAIDYWKATHPEPPPPPTAGFGLLPRPIFPSSERTPKSFKLEATIEAMRPTSDRAFVFYQPYRRASLLALDRAKEQARVLGFLFEPTRISDEIYRFRRTTPLPAVLDYNIITGTFTLRVDWQADPAFLSDNRLPNEDNAITTTKQLLASAQLLPKDMATASAKVSYLQSNGGALTNTVSFSEADFLQVDLFRTPINNTYPVLTARPSKGTVRAIISGKQDRNLQLVSLEYNYLPVEYFTAHTYAIITPSQAYQMLSSGNGYSAQISEELVDAVIRKVSLAYFDSGEQQEYLQPIYVFEGDGGYVGYVPAVNPTFFQAIQQ